MRIPCTAAILSVLLLGAVPGTSLRDSAPLTQTITVKGRVTDSATAKPLASATVTVVGRGATLTDSAGRYSLAITVPRLPAALSIQVRRVGYSALSRSVAAKASTVVVDFTLSAATARLDEIVATMGMLERRRVMAPSTMSPSLGSAKLRGLASNAAARDATLGYGGRRPFALTDSTTVVDSGGNTEAYDPIDENPFLSTRTNPRSTFSIDVDRASYSNVRRFLTGGSLPPRDAVRVEELVNYFPYHYAEPSNDHPVAVIADVMRAPWQPEHRLVRIALQARHMSAASMPPSNLVFLIDVSGSMQDPNKLPLVQQSLRLLVNELRPVDRVALVVYAGQAGLVLPSTAGDRKELILDAIDRLSAGGSTAGGAGIRLAYDVAKQNFIRGGNNRVILATDGDFNVGASSDAELVQLIEQKRTEGSYLTVLGFGTGNVKDAKMEKLADKGNGNYAYIDNILEARKTLVHEMGGTLLTVAKDVKLQVEFNPARVAAYRLIGYENRMLRDEDFTDDTKDAGEIGAGHSVTALYEIVPVGAKSPVVIRESTPLRYSADATPKGSRASDELLHVALRYKPPTSDKSIEIDQPLRDADAAPSSEFRFAAAVASFGMLLRHSPNAGKSNMEDVIAMAEGSMGADEFGYRAEFVRMARLALPMLVASDAKSATAPAR
jgi:Ca-activated chloride channel family protein